MQIVALADNGHSTIENSGTPARLELPVRLAAFSDGLYVMRATEINADLLGGRVTAVDGQPIDAVMTKVEQLRGGTRQWRRLLASQYLGVPRIYWRPLGRRLKAASNCSGLMPLRWLWRRTRL